MYNTQKVGRVQRAGYAGHQSVGRATGVNPVESCFKIRLSDQWYNSHMGYASYYKCTPSIYSCNPFFTQTRYFIYFNLILESISITFGHLEDTYS